MLSGVSILCFAASYTVTLALEITRLFFRSGIRGAIMLGFAGAGLFAHTVYLYYRAVEATGSPLSSSQDWCLVAAWALVAVYLYLTAYHPDTAFGLFILPLVLGLIGAGTFLADPEPFAREPASQVWGVIHGTSILLAVVALLVGFASGVMYLWQAYRLKHKLPPRRGLRLPSLEWLKRTSTRTIAVALLTLGAGIFSGMVLNRIQHGGESERLTWNDPVVLSTLVMFLWLVVSAGIRLFYKPAREGRRVAFLTIVSFVFLVVALALMLFGATRHGGPKRDGGKQTREGSGLRVQGSEVRVQGSGFRVQGFAPSRFPQTAGPGPLYLLDSAHPALCEHSLSPTNRSPFLNIRCPLPTAYCPLPTAYSVPSSRRNAT
ncbi:MAG: cytochrome c biogenesis protein CcsA [Planctomycetota bacterium]